MEGEQREIKQILNLMIRKMKQTETKTKLKVIVQRVS